MNSFKTSKGSCIFVLIEKYYKSMSLKGLVERQPPIPLGIES